MHYRKNFFGKMSENFVTMTLYGANGAKVWEKTNVEYSDVHETLYNMRQRGLPVGGISSMHISPFEKRSFALADGGKLTVRPAIRNNPSTKAERHVKRAAEYRGYKPKSKKFYVVVTTPPHGIEIAGEYATHQSAAKARESIARGLKSGNAFVKGEATLKRQGLL